MLIPIVNLSPGTWHLRSKSDPRWIYTGRGDVGNLTIPAGCTERTGELKLQLGEPPG